MSVEIGKVAQQIYERVALALLGNRPDAAS